MSITTDMCPNDKVALIQRPIERQTYEQRFCGVWYDCPQCSRSVLYPSAELLAQVTEMSQPKPVQGQLDLFPTKTRKGAREQVTA